MRPFLPLLIGMLTFSPVLTLAASGPVITLDATLEQPVCREGQPVVLALALHNNGTDSFVIGGSAFEESSFQIAVTDGAGKAVPRTAVGERVLTPPSVWYSNSTIDFAPGKTLSYRFNLARLFDLSRAGEYHVSAKRIVAKFGGWHPVGTPPLPETILATGSLTVRMTEDAAAVSGPTAYAPPPSRQPFLYAVGPDTDGICHYLISQDGSVSFSLAYSLQGSPRVARGTDSIVTTPNGRFLYVGNSSDHTVSQFRIGYNGVLFPLSPPTVPAHPSSSSLLMDPKGRFLYDLAGTVYAIGSDGRLTVTVSVDDNPPGKVKYSDKGNVVASYSGALDPTGTFLYGCGAITGGYHLAPDGTILTPPPPSKTVWPSGGNNNAVAISPSGKFVYVGISTTLSGAYFDRIAPMRAAPDGTLSALPGVVTPKPPPSEWPHQSRPDCIALSADPSGRFLIVVNPQYLACDRIGVDGSLTPVGAMPTGGDFTSVFFAPSGKIFFALNRELAPLAAFRLDDRLGLVKADVNLPSGIMFTEEMTSAAAPTPLKQGTAAGGVTVSAFLPADVLPSNAPVVLTVILKNVTQRSIKLDSSMASFQLALAGPRRQSPSSLQGDGEPLFGPVPLLAAGHALFEASRPPSAPGELLPGKERQYRFVLSRLADMTVAGHYAVQITSVFPNGTRVVSPALPFLLDGPFDGIVRDDKHSVQIL